MAKRNDKYKPRSDGRYYTHVSTGKYDENGRPIRISLYAKSSKELEEKVAEARYLLKTEQYVIEPEDITVYDYAEKWIRTYKSVKELNTNRMYMESLKYVVGLAIGEIKMSKLLSSDIQEMITDHKDHYRTCEIARMFMYQVIRRAVKDGILRNDICDNITLPSKPRTEKRALYEIEKKAVFSAELSNADRALVYILYGCGLRRQEVLALRIEDVDLKKKLISVRNVIVFDGNRSVWKAIPKSQDGQRSVPIPDDLIFAISRYIHNVSTNASIGPKDGPVLLFTTNGGMVTKSSFRVTWKRIIREINQAVSTKQAPNPVNGLTAHIFRHNYATMLYYSGISILKAADLMGHSDIKLIMEVYAHLDEEKEQAVDKINEVIRAVL